MSSLYQKLRPRTLKGLIGQDGVVASLQRLIEKDQIPHAILLSGASGCGKTTTARILKEHLKCGDRDFFEINAADSRGIDTVREMRRSIHLAPMHGEARVWLIDEAGKLSNDAQNALLKMLEDTPAHAYFMLATTDPQKLIRTIHTRCSEIVFSALSNGDLERLMKRVIDKEGFKVSDDVVSAIAEVVEGSGRKSLVLLEQVCHLETEEEQMAAIKATTFSKEKAIDLARLLVIGRGTWNDVATVLKAIKDEDAEGIRYCVLGYARACLVGGEGKSPNPSLGPRAFQVIDVFSDDFYTSKHAGLAAACYEVAVLTK